MADPAEYRCFIGGLSWTTTDQVLERAFEDFGHLVEARVVVDKYSGRSRGFGFVTYVDKKAMEKAIDEMNGKNLDGRAITVDKAQPQGLGRERDGDRYGQDFRDRGEYGGGGRSSSNGGDCFKCGKPGHFARECPSGDRSRGDRYVGSRSGGSSRYGSDRGGDRYGIRSKDGGSRSGGPGSDRYSRDRSGPYERPSGSSRS